MVRLDEVTATLNTLDQLSTTLEEGIEQYKHHVGVLRGQVQKIGARLSQYSSDAYKAIPGASSKDIDVINQLVAKVSSRFGKILNWRKGSSPTPSQSQGPKNASAHYSSRPTPSPPPSASTTEDPATKSNGDCETDSGIKRLTTEERLAQNERQLQAQLLQLDPDEMWAEIAQIWMKITWARSVFRHLPVDPVLKIAGDQQLGPPPSGIAKSLFNRRSSGSAGSGASQSVEERLLSCSSASKFEQILLSLQPDEMWEHVGSMYRELQWCSVVISALPKDELNSITTIHSIGPAPTGFFETIAAVVEAARAESGEDSPKDTGSSAGLGAAVEDVHDEVAEIDVGISVADELSIGNCYVLQNFMETYQHLPEYQLHCLRVMRTLIGTPLRGRSEDIELSALPSALAQFDTDTHLKSDAALARASSHPESWVCTCGFRNRGPTRSRSDAQGGKNEDRSKGPPPMPMAWLRGEIEKPAGEKDWGPDYPTSLVYTPEQQQRLGVDENGNPVHEQSQHKQDPYEETFECELCGVEFYVSEVSLEYISVEDFEATVSPRTMRERLVRLDCMKLVLHALHTYTKHKAIQRCGLFSLLQLTLNSRDSEAVTSIAQQDGMQVILDSMQAMLGDVGSQVAAFGLLASPLLIDEMVERVGMADYLSAVISAVKTHPTNPQIQGLGYLAMANLALRADHHVSDIVAAGGVEVILDSLAHMESEPSVQVAGFWVLCALTREVSNDAYKEARDIIQQSGRAGSFLKAVRRFPEHKKLREHAELLISNLLGDEESPRRGGSGAAASRNEQQHWASGHDASSGAPTDSNCSIQ